MDLRVTIATTGRVEETAAGRRKPLLMTAATAHCEPLEEALIRHSVDALEAGRTRCADCGRTPLLGERIHFYEGRTPALVCELCRMQRRDAPASIEVVRHGEHSHGVRITARAA